MRTSIDWIVFLTTSAWITQTFADETVSSAPDSCSTRIDLDATVEIFDTMISSIFVCTNGYITLGAAAPEVLAKPDDFLNLNTSTILAPLVRGEPSNFEAVFKQGSVVTNEISDVLTQMIAPEDPFFSFDYYFRVRWRVPAGMGLGNGFRIIVFQDNDYAGQGNQKILVLIDYESIRNGQDDATGQYVRAGFNSPNNSLVIFIT